MENQLSNYGGGKKNDIQQKIYLKKKVTFGPA